MPETCEDYERWENILCSECIHYGVHSGTCQNVNSSWFKKLCPYKHGVHPNLAKQLQEILDSKIKPDPQIKSSLPLSWRTDNDSDGEE